MDLQGCGTALITPFRPDNTLDEPAISSLVHWQIDSGISFLVAAGSTGEASTLTEYETVRLIETVVGSAAGRVPVLAGCTHNNTAEAIARVEKLSRIPGLSGILTANPYYNKPSQEGQYLHFKAIADASALPVMLYNIPGRTAANLEPATVLRLAEHRNIVGIKESSGNIAQISEIIATAPRNFRVFAGDDGIALPAIAQGASGLISVGSNVIPHHMAQMIDAALNNDWSTARRIQRHYSKFLNALYWEPNPSPTKAILTLMGKIHGGLRLPMTEVSPVTRRKLDILIGELGLLVDALPTGEDLRVF